MDTKTSDKFGKIEQTRSFQEVVAKMKNLRLVKPRIDACYVLANVHTKISAMKKLVKKMARKHQVLTRVKKFIFKPIVIPHKRGTYTFKHRFDSAIVIRIRQDRKKAAIKPKRKARQNKTE